MLIFRFTEQRKVLRKTLPVPTTRKISSCLSSFFSTIADKPLTKHGHGFAIDLRSKSHKAWAVKRAVIYGFDKISLAHSRSPRSVLNYLIIELAGPRVAGRKAFHFHFY